MLSKKLAVAASLLLLGTGVVGCNKTAEGVADDTKENAKAVDDTAKKAGQEVKDTAVKAGDTVKEGVANLADATITPKVKAAIVADPELGKDGNAVINVDTHDNKVILRGHVKTNEMKKKAEDLAKKFLTEGKYTNEVVNTLTVDTH